MWFHGNNDIDTLPAILIEWKRKGAEVLKLVKHKDLVIQAGGSVGVFPLNLAKEFKQVITFEPIVDTYNYLIQNTKEYPNIKPINKALGANKSMASVARSIPKNSGATTIEYDSSGPLEVVTLDSLNLPYLDLLWLDIEGFELEALRGGFDTIIRHRPVIVLENNGLAKGYEEGGLEGSIEFRRVVEAIYGYKFHTRLMRDDVFIPIE